MIKIDELYPAVGIAPVADAFAGTKYSEEYDMAKFEKAFFLISKGVGTTGTSTVTVEAIDNSTSPPTVTAVPFRYIAVVDNETPAAAAEAAAAGFTLTAGSNQTYLVEVDPSHFGKLFADAVRLKLAEVVDSAVLAGVAFLGFPKNAQLTDSAQN